MKCSGMPENVVVVTNNPEVNGFTRHLKRHAVMQINARLPHAFSSTNPLDLERWMIKVASQQPQLLIHFFL